MCIDFDGHHSDGSSFVYVNDFVITEIVCIPTGTSSALEKKVKSPGIWSHTPKPVRIRQSGLTGNRGVTDLESHKLIQYRVQLQGVGDKDLP